MEKKIEQWMVDELNLFFTKSGCDLRYVSTVDDMFTTNYKLLVVNKFIDNKYASEITLSKSGEAEIKKFIKDNFGDINTGYSNQINNLIVFKELNK